MKRFVIFCMLSFAITCANAWNITIFNVGQNMDMYVTYHACAGIFVEDKNRKCSIPQTILVKNKKNNDDINYVTIKFAVDMPQPKTQLEIISVEERDASGLVRSSGKFTNDTTHNWCGGSLLDEGSTNIFVLLDDMKGSPFISCHTTLWSYNV